MIVGNMQQVRVCGICAHFGHPTNICHVLQEDDQQHIYAIREFFNQLKEIYDPYSNTHNLGWRDYPNFGYEARQQNF